MSGPISLFEGLARDVSLLPPLPDASILPRTWDAILLNDDFSGGINGWHTHTNAFPPSLSDHGFNRSPHSLKLSTGVGAVGRVGGQNSIYKRIGRTFDDGYLVFGGWFAFRGTDEQASPQLLGLGIDHQKFDDSGRSLSTLSLRRYGPTSPDTFAPKWTLGLDQLPSAPANNTFCTIPGAAAATYPATKGSGAVPGYNLDHGNFWFAALVMSCNDSDNNGVGIGRYWRAVLGNQVFDLSTLHTNATQDGPGSGAQPPQTAIGTGGTNPAGSFSGELNFGLNINNRANSNDGPASFFAGHVFAAHYPVGTVFPTSVREAA